MITNFSYRIPLFLFFIILFRLSFAQHSESFEQSQTIQNKKGQNKEQKLNSWNQTVKGDSTEEIGDAKKQHQLRIEQHIVENEFQKQQLRFQRQGQKQESQGEQRDNYQNKNFQLKQTNQASHNNLGQTHSLSENQPKIVITHQNSSESGNNTESPGDASQDLRIPNEQKQRQDNQEQQRSGQNKQLVEVGQKQQQKALNISEQKTHQHLIQQQQQQSQTQHKKSLQEPVQTNQHKSEMVKIEAKDDQPITETQATDNQVTNDYDQEESENTLPPRIQQPFFHQEQQLLEEEQRETSQVKIPSRLINQLQNSSNMSNRIPFDKTIFKSVPLIDYSSQLISHENIPAYITLLQALFNYGMNILPVRIKNEMLSILYSLIDQCVRQLIPFINELNKLYKEINKEIEQSSQVNIWYQTNYADRYGGAKILMKSSDILMSINSILDSDTDKYMYTQSALPIRIIIALNEYIAIESIIILSREMYSCITKQFKVEGKFTLDDKKWVPMGTYTAENVFGQQQFYTEKKIFRYIRISIISAYGKWSYFTLTQIQIRGKSLLDDAVTEKKSGSEVEEEFVEHESYGDGEVQQANICIKQEFKSPSSSEPHQNNLIGSLITSIDSLKSYNQNQGKQIKYLTEKLKDISSGIETTNLQNKFYEKLIEQYKRQSNNNHYVIIFSLLLSIITLLALVCMCLLRRKQLLLNKMNGGREGSGTVKKSNSFK